MHSPRALNLVSHSPNWPAIWSRFVPVGVLLFACVIGGAFSAVLPIAAVGIVALAISCAAFAIFRPSLVSAILLFGGTVDIFVQVQFGPISLMGASTIIIAALTWTYLLLSQPRQMSFSLIQYSWILFCLWCFLSSILWYKPTISGIQNLMVTVAFVGVMLFSAVHTALRPDSYQAIGRLVGWSSWIAAALYTFRSFLSSIDDRLSINSRSFALFALFGIAWFLAESRYGKPKAIWHAVGLTLIIALSLSRTATAVALFMFALSRFHPKGIRGWITFLGSSGIVAAAGYYAVTQVAMIRDRFTEGDVSMEVGGIAINSTGRTAMWETTRESFWDSPWVGKGSGSASSLIESYFPTLGHPHNDYLRILHDFGMIGFGIWLVGQIALVVVIASAWIRLDTQRDPRARIHLTALLSLMAIYVTMITDNVIVYAFIMLPVGVIIGASLGTIQPSPNPDTTDNHHPSLTHPQGLPRLDQGRAS